MALPSDIPTPENLERSRQQVEEEQRRKAQRDSQLSALDKALGAYEAARTIGSALYQKAASFPTFLSQGQEAADKQVAERMFIPKTETGINYLQNTGQFLEELETKHKIPPLIPEAALLQNIAGPATKQATRAAGRAVGSAIDQAMMEGTGPFRKAIPEAVRPMNVIRRETGEWFKDSIFDKAPDQSARIKSIEQDLKDPNISAQNKEILQRQYTYLKNTDALNRWEKGNLANYVKNKMATPEDPIRALAERGVTHLPQDPDWNEYVHVPTAIRKKREEAGFDEEGLGKSPQARLWEVMSDEALIPFRAGNYQEALKAQSRLDKMQPELAAAVERVNRNFDQALRSSGIPLSEVNNRNVHTHIADKAEKIGDKAFEKLWYEQDQLNKLVSGSIGYLAQQNPWISNLHPEDPIYRAKIRNLGFDHVLDVLREDLNSGRIRPEQLNKISVEQAIKRTHEYDQEMAKKMRETTAAVREGLPVYKQYPQGFRWIELNKPGAFAHESDMMGHSVRGYEPPKGHEDWVETSKDYGSEGYGHGGWDAIKSGRAKVYSLVDEKGEPHVTVELKKSAPRHEEVLAEMKASGLDTSKLDEGAYDAAYEKALQRLKQTGPSEITQIKGKSNQAPKETYLPFVQDFVRSGKWSQINDTRNAGLRRYGDVFNVNEQRKIESLGGNVPDHEWLTGEEIQQLHNLITPEGGRLKYDSKGNIIGGEGKSGYKQGGKVHISSNPDTMRIELAEGKKMQVGGIAKAAAKRAAKAAKAIEPLPASESAQNLKKFLEGSKVVDDEGNPLRVYHGTDSDFNVFDSSRRRDDGLLFFTTEKGFAQEYAEDSPFVSGDVRVMEVYLSAQNPWDYRNPEHVSSLIRGLKKRGVEIDDDYREAIKDGDWMAMEEGAGNPVNIIREMGHDGIWMTEGSDMTRNIAVFRPDQIKSAIGNRGTYDINDPDITKADGGSVEKEPSPLNRAFANTFHGIADGRDVETLMVGLGMNPATLGISVSKMPEAEHQQIATNLMARYGTNLGSLGLHAQAVRPLDAPAGVFDAGVGASYPVGPGKAVVGANFTRTPEETRYTGSHIGYHGKLGPGRLMAGVNIPKGQKPSAQLQYQIPFADGGAVKMNEGGKSVMDPDYKAPTKAELAKRGLLESLVGMITAPADMLIASRNMLAKDSEPWRTAPQVAAESLGMAEPRPFTEDQALVDFASSVGDAAPLGALGAAKALRNTVPSQGGMGIANQRGAIDVSHGSPHKFDKFDFSKIGTGEGAQSFGYGGYMAEGFDSPVAKEYQKMFGTRAIEKVPEYQAALKEQERLSDLLDSKYGVTDISTLMEGVATGETYGVPQKVINAVINSQNKLKQAYDKAATSAYLYNARMAWPDAAREAKDPLGPQHFLDWDKPLSEQSPTVQKIIGDEIKRIGGSAHSGERAYKELMFDARMSGTRANSQALRNNIEAAAASNRLRELGIPGIRYLDQGSRGAGTGTSNYVVFPGNENLLTILERNKQPISQKADGGAVKMAGGGSFAKSLAKLARAQAKSRQEIDAIAERIAPQVTGEYVRESDKSARTVAGKTQKQFEREKDLPVDIRPDVEQKVPAPVDIESLKGSVMIGIPGDPTVTAQTLHGVGDVKLKSPSPQHGGPLYGLYGDPEHFWASGLGAASRVQNLAEEAGRQYDAPVVGKYVMMGPESINYAQHFADANLQAIDTRKMTREQIEGFNELIRKGNPKSGPRPSFPGIQDKGGAYLHFSVDPELRKHFNSLMQQPTVVDQFGLPSGQDIRMAITEPALRNLETGVTGFSMGRMKPEVKKQDLSLSPHPTYSHDIPGEFIGQSKYPVPYELSFPDTLKAIRENPKQAPQEFGSLKMVGPRQTIDQQLIDEIKMYEEKMKRLTGKKKGGAAKKRKVKISNSRDAHFLVSLD